MNQLRFKQVNDGKIDVGVRKLGSHTTYTKIGVSIDSRLNLDDDDALNAFVRKYYADWNIASIAVERKLTRTINV